MASSSHSCPGTHQILELHIQVLLDGEARVRDGLVEVGVQVSQHLEGRRGRTLNSQLWGQRQAGWVIVRGIEASFLPRTRPWQLFLHVSSGNQCP